MKEKPRCSMKVVYSCFDCLFFVNKSSHIDIQKEKYRCMVEKRDFSFNEMAPDGVPKWCPLPFYDKVKSDKGFKPFKLIFDKLEKS